MKRSEINQLIQDASACFTAHGWALPPTPKWDVTDFGIGNWRSFGLVLVNLAEEPEYCEKLMYAKQGMVTPTHRHAKKKEDIIARWGSLSVKVWAPAAQGDGTAFEIKVNGTVREVVGGVAITLAPGERVTLIPGVWHQFEPKTEECIIGEVSTANDDLNDNFFQDPAIGRFPDIEEDEAAIQRLIGDRD